LDTFESDSYLSSTGGSAEIPRTLLLEIPVLIGYYNSDSSEDGETSGKVTNGKKS
jgi:hypothetical protein